MAAQHASTMQPEARQFRVVGFADDFSCVIGRSPDAEIRYEAPEVSGGHARLTLRGDAFTVEDLGSTNGTLVNGRALPARTPLRLRAGDVVQIAAFKCMVGNRYVVANCRRSVPLEASIEVARPIEHAAFRAASPDPVEPTGEEHLFYPAPRLMHSVHRRAFSVDGPPPGRKRDESPAIMQLGPSFIMGLASVFMVANTVSRLMAGADVTSTLPMLAMSISMIAGMLVWPLVSRRYERRRDEREEARRESTYTDYLNAIEHALQQECAVQGGMLAENRVTVPALLDRASTLSPELMNRTSAHSDFMDLRVGTGDLPLEADVRWPAEQFAVDRDRLLAKVIEASHRPPFLAGVPLAFNPAEHYVAGVVGPTERVWAFARGLVVQLCALMSYQDVKLMLVADAGEEAEWGCMRALPHLFDDAGRTRFLATGPEGLMGLTMHLERELERRGAQRGEEALEAGPRYVVLCANKALTDPSDTIGRLARLRAYRGVSLIFMGDELKDLPRECAYVIDLAGAVAGEGGASQPGACMFDRADVSGTMLPFSSDIGVSPQDMEAFARCMARVHLDMPGQRSTLPASLGFLEMFEAGNVGQLGIAARWAAADASRTLQAPVGVDAQGEPAMLNLHEKVHGPHGLIAGTTGSGKSEFIITYVLSLAACYPPDQVAFVLIDYKGGGLAGAFDNERFRLPHLAGTITNLDGAAISRSLVSIKSELKRRQDAFNRAREATGEATMDIYKYISYYLRGVLSEPIPHLFIVADEFAELKQQEPEFMDELMSAARIGRSLGVHLILATQKPSGVVNDQIRSNMRFKVCLKVADAGDSKEMIGRADAAEIREPGRFYLLVGFNEYFTGGQAAYAGAPYAPVERFAPKRDDAVELIDDEGTPVASARPAAVAVKSGLSEINAALGEIQRQASGQRLAAARLWLDPLPDWLGLAELEGRYAGELEAARMDNGFAAMLGEIDMPAEQRRAPHIVDFRHNGNLMIYGAQGTGTDELIATAICSLARGYSAEEFSFYVLDFDAGMLSCLRALPCCGGIVLPGNDELARNLFKMLEEEIVVRRGRIASGARWGHEPSIVVAIANLAAFYEAYADLEDRLNALVRDAARYGIYFVVTATGATVPRLRFRSAFSMSITTVLNDEGDYATIFGHRPDVKVAKGNMRGVAQRDKSLYEFQGADFCDKNQTAAEAIAALASRLSMENGGAQATTIPVLPDAVTERDMSEAPSAYSVPVGFAHASVAPLWFDLERLPSMLVVSNEMTPIGAYMRAVCSLFESEGIPYRAVDLSGELNSLPHVLNEPEDIASFVDSLSADAEAVPRMLILMDISSLLGSLPVEASRALAAYVAQEKGKGRTGVIATSEMWRIRGKYDDWFKALTAYGNGLWIGSGVLDQTVFKVPRALPEHRRSIPASEGFVFLRGESIWTRLLQETAEGGCDDVSAR